MKFGSPVVLTNQVSLAVAGTPANFAAASLQPPNREAIAVHEIRFYAGYSSRVTPQFQNPSFQPGRELRVTMSVGPYNISTNVPLWAISPVMDQDLENPGGLLGCYRLRLKRPMFVPPGVTVQASAQRIPDAYGQTFIADAIPLSISLIGRTVVGDFPRTTQVPFLSSYVPAAWAPGYVGIRNSTGDELCNSLNKTVELHYAIGRMGFGWLVPNAAQTWPAGNIGNLLIGDLIDPRLVAPMQLHHGFSDIVPAGTEFNMAFDMATRCLPMNGVGLNSGERIVFTMANPPAWGYSVLELNGVGYSLGVWMPTVSIVGSRSEVMS